MVYVPYEFIPNFQLIIGITQALQAVVTFSTDHNFTIAEWISFRIPPESGMIQLNNQKGLIIALTSNTVTIDVDTLTFFPFINAPTAQIYCVAVPAGSGVIPDTATVTLEDAFDNRPLL